MNPAHWWLCPACEWEGDEAAFTLSASVEGFCPECEHPVTVHPDLLLQPSGHRQLAPDDFEARFGGGA